MNQELQDKLYKDFPSLFINDRFDGFWVPDGWHDLIYNLSKDISALNLNVHVVQIKIKFGGMRYYLHEHHSEIEKLIGVAEERSYYTCECCGKYKQEENKLCDTCSIIKNIIE